jgi:hypothetical protein
MNLEYELGDQVGAFDIKKQKKILCKRTFNQLSLNNFLQHAN